MDYDTTKVDEVALALLHLNAHADHGITRAWKGFDWTRWTACTPWSSGGKQEP
jgi:hypothetical protein